MIVSRLATLMTSTPDHNQTGLRRFFERYAAASQKDNPEALAAMYAPTFIVGGPQGSMTFANDARFLAWLAQVHEFNEKHGMRSLEVINVDIITASPRHVFALVRWGARFEKTGSQIIEFEISYLLESADDDWRILSYISRADQEEEMKRLGLL